MPSAEPPPAGAPTVAVVGAGALGCLFAARLAESGADTWLVDHRASTVEALRARGIVLHEPAGVRSVAVRAAVDPSEVPPAALAVLLVKAPALPAAAATARALLAPDGRALALQNAIGHGETVAAAAGAGRTLHGITYANAVRLAPGEIRPNEHGPSVFGPLRPAPPEGAAAAVAALERAGLEPRYLDDPTPAIWEKGVIAASLNATTAILRVRLGALAGSAAAAGIVDALFAEALAVAARSGVEIDGEALRARRIRICGDVADTVPSMLQDVLAGRPTEIDALNGEIARRAEALGLPAPANRMVVELVRAIEQTVPQRVSRAV